MKIKYIIITLFCLLSKIAASQNTFETAYDFGEFSEAFGGSNTQSTLYSGDDFDGREWKDIETKHSPYLNDVFHKFTITKEMCVTISHCGSELTETCMYILKEHFWGFDFWEYNEESFADGACSQPDQAYIKYDNLSPGTYYIVSEGFSKNGGITVRLEGMPPKKIYNIGTKNSSFIYAHIQDTKLCGNYYEGKPSNDVNYVFKITEPMEITVSHCGSELSYTFIHLLDANGDRIAYHDGLNEKSICDCNTQAYLKMYNLRAGTYTVISEGYGQNGKIKTTIEGYLQKEDKLIANTTVNHIYTRTYTYNPTHPYLDEIEYFDGLGYPIQSVQRKRTPAENDLISFKEYDSFGRESTTWLPISEKNNGNYVPYGMFKKSSNLFYNDISYNKAIYEASPLNRVVEQYGPGKDWHNNGKSVKTNYLTNNSSYPCKYFVALQNSTDSRLRLINQEYASRQLYVTEMIDEDGNKSYEFKDKLGQVILTRQINNNQKHDTYYVYDDFGNLCYVLPPLASDALTGNNQQWDETDETLKKYAYLYKYDERNRCIWKKLPGCEPVYYVYDKTDHLIFTQDGEMRKGREWMFSIPDELSREVLTGICKNNIPSANYKDYLKGKVVKAQRTNLSTMKGFAIKANDTDFTLTSATVYTANYYDDYNYSNAFGSSIYSRLAYDERVNYGKRYNQTPYSAKGLLTGTYVNSFPLGLDRYTSLYYDERGRLIQSKMASIEGNIIDSEYIAYNFTGQPVKNLKVQEMVTMPLLTEEYEYEYDHAGRLKQTLHRLNGGNPVVLAYNEYDELGRLKSTKANNNERLKLTYDYNIRSWVKEISGQLFSQKLFYNNITGYMGDYGRGNQGTSSYSGNISGAMYKSGTSYWVGYNYYYDNLSRLSTAESFRVGNNPNPYTYFNTAYSYDKHGNMTNIFRMEDVDCLDNLDFYYNGNQIMRVIQGGFVEYPYTAYTFQDYSGGANVNFEYNANGAMTKDPYKGMTISYYTFGLPNRISVDNPITKGNLSYYYTAKGERIYSESHTYSQLSLNAMANSDESLNVSNLATIRDVKIYQGNKIYNMSQVLELDKILIDNGYIQDGNYYFYLRDHLGNNSVVANASGQRIQNYFYYPFGMYLGEYETSGYWDAEEDSMQPYKYGGKELQSMHGINLYDFHARQYDAVLGRFTSVDPHAEKYFSWSPYAYCANNPIKIIDPTGMYWLNSNDEYYANSLSTAIMNKKQDEQKVLDKLISKIEENQKAGKSVLKDQAKAAKIQANIDNLSSSISELKEMGDSKDQAFTFKMVDEDLGGAIRRGDGIIEMSIASDGAFGNGIHESTHGYDLWKDGGNTTANILDREIKAYSRQFSLDKKSMPYSTLGGVPSDLNKITGRWLYGIKYQGRFIYIEFAFPGANPNNIYNMIKRNK